MVRVINFLSIFPKNGQSNLVVVLVLVLQSKGPYGKIGGWARLELTDALGSLGKDDVDGSENVICISKYNFAFLQQGSTCHKT